MIALRFIRRQRWVCSFTSAFRQEPARARWGEVRWPQRVWPCWGPCCRISPPAPPAGPPRRSTSACEPKRHAGVSPIGRTSIGPSRPSTNSCCSALARQAERTFVIAPESDGVLLRAAARRAAGGTISRPHGRGDRDLFGQAGLLRASHAARFADDCHASIRSVPPRHRLPFRSSSSHATEPVRKRRI